MFNQLADWLDAPDRLSRPGPRGARGADPRRRTLAVRLRVGADLDLPDPAGDRPAPDDLVQPVVVDGLGERLLHQRQDGDGLVHPGHPPLRLAGDGGPAGPAPAPGALGRRLPRPREVNWWFGMALMFLTLGFSLTGYLLPWDQKGYWATKVATNITGGAPVLGPYHPEDRRRRHATTATRRSRGSTACTSASCRRCWSSAWRPTSPCSASTASPPPRQRAGRRASSGPSSSSWTPSPASPCSASWSSWSSRGRGQPRRPRRPLERELPGASRVVLPLALPDAQVLPGRARGHRHDRHPDGDHGRPAALPLFDRILPGRLAHFLACCVRLRPGRRRGLPDGRGHARGRPRTRSSSPTARRPTRPADGRSSWPRPRRWASPPTARRTSCSATRSTHGRAVLERKCLGCHYYDGKGRRRAGRPRDLKDFGSRAWVRGLLENPQAAAYFGKVPQCDGMAEWKKNSKLTPKELDDVADFVASFAKIAPGTTPEEWLNDPKVAEHPGSSPSRRNAAQCHVIEGLSEGGGLRDAPKLFAWGSPQWIARMIHKPGAPDLYGYLEKKDQMPAFAATIDRERHGDAHPLPQRLSRATFPSEAPPKTAVARPSLENARRLLDRGSMWSGAGRSGGWLMARLSTPRGRPPRSRRTASIINATSTTSETAIFLEAANL